MALYDVLMLTYTNVLGLIEKPSERLTEALRAIFTAVIQQYTLHHPSSMRLGGQYRKNDTLCRCCYTLE